MRYDIIKYPLIKSDVSSVGFLAGDGFLYRELSLRVDQYVDTMFVTKEETWMMHRVVETKQNCLNPIGIGMQNGLLCRLASVKCFWLYPKVKYWNKLKVYNEVYYWESLNI